MYKAARIPQYLLVIIFLIIINGLSIAQKPADNSFKYADKEFYLIDSLILENLTMYDQLLIDSVLQAYHKESQDTSKIKILKGLTENMMHDDWVKYNAFVYEMAINISEQLKHSEKSKKFKKIEAEALNNFAIYYGGKGNDYAALEYTLKGMEIQEKINDDVGRAFSMITVGAIYNNQGNFTQALTYFDESLNIFERLKNTSGKAACFNNLGSLYTSTGDINNALKFFKKSEVLNLEINDNYGLSVAYNNIGKLLLTQQKFDEALDYMTKSIAIREKMGDKKGESSSLYAIGGAYLKLKDTIQARIYFEKSLQISLSINNLNGIVGSLIELGRLDLIFRDFTEALSNGNKAYELASRSGHPQLIEMSSLLLLNIYEKQGNWKQALAMQKTYIQMHDSLLKEENNKAVYKQQINYEYQHKEQLREIEEEKSLAIADEKALRKNLIIVAIGFCLFVVLFFMLFLYNRFRTIRTQKRIIEKQSFRIQDSIIYAQNIQKAVLTSYNDFENNFKDSFLFYKPKDVVSGDFYWFYKKGGKIFFSVIDCTGHGVSGAFMTLISDNLMEKIIINDNIESPDLILNQLNIEMTHKLSNGDGDKDVVDGMDLVLCVLDTEKNILQFAGAHNKLFHLRNNDLLIYHGDNMGIGGFGKKRKDKLFTLQSIDLEINDSIYLFTDGYVDQLGGPKGSKFYIQRLADLIKQNGHKSMKEQKENIENTYTAWLNQGNFNQIDDICVLGIKI